MMDIRPIQQIYSLSRIGNQPNRDRSESAGNEDGVQADFSRSMRIHRSLSAAEDIRPEKVSEARRLIAADDFPSDAELSAVSQLLVGHLSTSNNRD